MKKWLIRMADGRIFGPLEREQVIQSYRDKLLSEKDEICCGMGYWFYVSEKEIMEKYLFNESNDFGAVSLDNHSDKVFDDVDTDITLISDVSGFVTKKNPCQEKENPVVNIAERVVGYSEKEKIKTAERASLSPRLVKSSRKKNNRDGRYLMIFIIVILSLLGLMIKKYAKMFVFFCLLIFISTYSAFSSLVDEEIFKSERGSLVKKETINGVMFQIKANKNINPCFFL